MPRTTSWHEDLTLWGHQESDDVQLWREADAIEELMIRIDVRKDCSAMVQQSVSIAHKLNCSFLMMEAAAIIEPSVEQLASRMLNSTAVRFTEDPIGTLENLPPVRTPKFRPDRS